MKTKSLIKITFSIILALALIITTVTISPRVASAENTSNTALEALERGIEFSEQGDLDNAESLYQEAIKSIESSGSIEKFLLAKSRLIETQFLRGKITETEANRLLQQIRTGYASFKDPAPLQCGECQRNGRDGYCVRFPDPNQICCNQKGQICIICSL